MPPRARVPPELELCHSRCLSYLPLPSDHAARRWSIPCENTSRCISSPHKALRLWKRPDPAHGVHISASQLPDCLPPRGGGISGPQPGHLLHPSAAMLERVRDQASVPPPSPLKPRPPMRPLERLPPGKQLKQQSACLVVGGMILIGRSSRSGMSVRLYFPAPPLP